MNVCTACGRDFGSLKAFDAHRVGKFPQTGPADWLDRVRAGLVDAGEEWRPDFGRRCLDVEELDRFEKINGKWSIAADVAHIRAYYRTGPLR